ncbi:hypothetical protein [Methanococcoides sp. AM1]|uniref:hypothetical protein n=1 Tax=Methanococcoides sp. AM1 TaxID=1201011 RepID=UPI0010848A4A|nr:hypothetical protein [Methanococcoides sp. AM1]
MKLLSHLFSSKPSTKKTTSTQTVGALPGTTQYDTYDTTLKWITETRRKLPELSASDRADAFNTDPLLKGTITPFLKNTILGSYHIETADDKKHEAFIDEINQFLEDIALMDVFRDDFIDYAIKWGHSYRRQDFDGDTLQKLSPLDCGTIKTYTDNWDADIIAYHQKITVRKGWNESPTSEEFNSWFIPGGELYIEGEVEDPKAKAIFDELTDQYGIVDTTNLRVDSTSRIIAMHRVNPGDPAPIDDVVLAIWLKRLLLTNSPNIIFRVLSPFIHAKNGVLVETSVDGDKQVLSSVPSLPPAGMETTDPEAYAAELAAHTAWVDSCKESVKTVMSCLKDGGVFSSGPDTSIEVVESGRTVPSAFIKMMLDILDEEIGQAFGFPISLIKANGSELATSRTILEFFNTVYAGVRKDYQSVADALIREKFGDKADAAQVKFVLDTGDVKEQLKIAQAKLTDAKRLQVLKQIGGSKTDVQAAAEQAGFGSLELENFDTAATPANPFGSIVSSGKDDLKPSDEDGDKLAKDLLKAYTDAQAAVTDILE